MTGRVGLRGANLHADHRDDLALDGKGRRAAPDLTRRLRARSGNAAADEQSHGKDRWESGFHGLGLQVGVEVRLNWQIRCPSVELNLVIQLRRNSAVIGAHPHWGEGAPCSAGAGVSYERRNARTASTRR